jgi:uncharacterized membrane protein YdjX (TVP38/TMEM64 family)
VKYQKPNLKYLFMILAIIFLVSIALFEAITPEDVRDFVLGFGIYAPLVFSLVYLISLFLPFGTTLTSIAAGLTFGVIYGGIFTVLLATFLSVIPFLISRKLGNEWVNKQVKGTKAERYADIINERSFLIIFYLRLIPSIPFELQNYIAGVTNITTRQFMIATFFGIMPIIFILTFLGESLTVFGSARFWIAIGIFLFALLTPPLYYYYSSHKKTNANK